MCLFKKNELVLAVREWLPVADTGFYGQGTAKLMARLNKFINMIGGIL
jgi:hypothetical protein